MRINPTQAALDDAAELRAFESHVTAINVRDSVVPLAWRRLAALAELVRQAPAAPPRVWIARKWRRPA